MDIMFYNILRIFQRIEHEILLNYLFENKANIYHLDTFRSNATPGSILIKRSILFNQIVFLNENLKYERTSTIYH